MALQDTMTNLGTAIINLVTSKITKHDAEIEKTLLDLKAKVDALIENSGSNGDVGDSDETENIETVTIDGYTAKVTTKTTSDEAGDDIFWTTYTFTAPITGSCIFFTCVNSDGETMEDLTDIIYKSSVDEENISNDYEHDPEFGMIAITNASDVSVQVLSIGSYDKITITNIVVES